MKTKHLQHQQVVEHPDDVKKLQIIAAHAIKDIQYPRTVHTCAHCGSRTTLRVYRKDRKKPCDEWHVVKGVDTRGNKLYWCDNCYRRKSRSSRKDTEKYNIPLGRKEIRTELGDKDSKKKGKDKSKQGSKGGSKSRFSASKTTVSKTKKK